MKILTTHVIPPIPTRAFDWSARIDGQEDGPNGWGASQQEAIDDLQSQLEEPLSNCCGAPPLGEIHNNFAPCSDCKEMAEFKEEEV